MPRNLILLSGLFILAFGLANAKPPRLSIRVDDVIASRNDTLITVPIHLAHPNDTIAGIELYIRLPKNNRLTFALDDVDRNGLYIAADTTGTMISGWEWLGVSSKEHGLFDLKLSAMADWPDKTETPPAFPAEDDLLVKLKLRQNIEHPLDNDTVFSVTIDSKGSGFADPHGNSIGVVTAIENECQKYQGDSCLVWKRVRRGYLDTIMVGFKSGNVTIIDTLGGSK